MKNKCWLPVLLLGAAGVTAPLAAQTTRQPRTFRFTYTASLSGFPAGARSASLWLPYPQSTPHQTIHQVKIHAPGPVTLGREPRYGNQAVFYTASNPKEPVTVTLEITATRREHAGLPETLSPAERRDYLKAEPLVPLDGPVKALAEEAVRGKRSNAAKARAIYEKVTGMVKYDKSGTGWGRGDAIFACDAKRGNCTDFHALIIGMARAQGIPARFSMGVSLPEKRGEGEIPGYHCWAELYVKGEWVPVDSSEAARALANQDAVKKEYYYGHHDENRLEFSRSRHLVLTPPQQGEPLNYFIYPYAEVDGKKHAAITHRFSFQDLPAAEAGVSR